MTKTKPWILFSLALILGCPSANDDDSSATDDDDAVADDDDSTALGSLRTFTVESDGNMGGPSGADALCAASADNPDTSATWKAMLGGLSRVPCADADCDSGTAGQVDWVLQPSTTYTRPQGGAFFTTDANGVITTYPLDGAMLDNATNFWTGLDSDWTVYTDFHCNDWTTNGVQVRGRVGWSVGTDAAWIQGGDLACDSVLPVLCVEQ